MSKKNKKYALWCQFTKSDMDILEKLQLMVNKKFEGPKFEIHLTLLGSLMIINNNIINQITKQCKVIKQIKIIPSRYNISKKNFMSLFIEIKKTNDLLNLKNIFENLLKTQSNKEFIPHISLTYGYFNKNDKMEYVAKLDQLDAEFTLDRICIVDVSSDVPSWKIVKTFFLQKSN